MIVNGFHAHFVEGLGDEEIPWWIAPYVRNFAELAKSQGIARVESNPMPGVALASLAFKLSQTAAVARVAAHVKGGEGLSGGASAAMEDEIDLYCGTPPRPHHIDQAGLVVALLAAGLDAKDPAKAALVGQAERLQGMRGR